MENTQHPLAGKKVRIKSKTPEFDGRDFVVEDWWHRINGYGWRDQKGARNPANLVYSVRAGKNDLPFDDYVVYGKIEGMGYLVHDSEIVAPEAQKKQEEKKAKFDFNNPKLVMEGIIRKNSPTHMRFIDVGVDVLNGKTFSAEDLAVMATISGTMLESMASDIKDLVNLAATLYLQNVEIREGIDGPGKGINRGIAMPTDRAIALAFKRAVNHFKDNKVSGETVALKDYLAMIGEELPNG